MKRRLKRVIHVLSVIYCLLAFSPTYLCIRYILISLLKKINVHNWERLLSLVKGACLIVVTHDTYLEPALTYALLVDKAWRAVPKAIFTWNFGEIERWIPLSLVTSKYRPLLILLPVLLPLSSIFIWVERGEEEDGVRKRSRAIRRVIDCIERGLSVQSASQGTRTHKYPEEMRVKSKKGNEIGPFQSGTGFIAAKTKKALLPIGYRRTIKVLPNSPWALIILIFLAFPPFLILYVYWKGPIDVNIGEPCRIVIDDSLGKEEARRKADQEAEERLLETLDEITP